MKVLFVPKVLGGMAHVIPLLALRRKLKDAQIETAFLAPREFHKILRLLGENVLDIDNQPFGHEGFRLEMIAYGKFQPDVVIDDMDVTTRYAAALSRVPRVAIQRYGMFPGEKPGNENHRHTSEIFTLNVDYFEDVSFLGIPQPRTLYDLFEGEVKIIPGIRTIEVLPDLVQNDPTYIYAGPLLMDDYLCTKEGPLDFNFRQEFSPLEEFFEKNKGRRVVFVTFGTTLSAQAELLEAIRCLLDSDIAVVSTIKLGRLNPREEVLFFYARWLPMHFVCSHVDLVVHQCGSGTYHYPLIHNVPSLTIGTTYYDNEDIALRLVELGVSMHQKAPSECDNFLRDFKSKIALYFENSGARLLETRQKVGKLNAEIRQTSEAFDLEWVLRKVTGENDTGAECRAGKTRREEPSAG